ncbi:hypothetical protein fugu_007584 [Takifugu bimaculatus]|uniref:Uncharacterized protein n=1 Tax=Takifugu bimaculatus TaxID=433685 RepID=A0A4Z2AYT9_9TELE|nr:hypothetical protein fugu_007584 [Takifugu bimaculatus]
MRSRNLFLLVYFAWGCFGSSGPQISATCAPAGMCEVPNPTWSFLQCVGLPPTDAGRDHIHRLKQILEAAMDVYTFMKSSMKGVPVLSLQGALHLNPKVDPHQNEAVIQMWMEVKLKPLLHSITKHFLSCLSTKNFSCSTYQNVVKELSHHFSEMNPVRQKWIYTFFMYPFLSGDRVDGCVRQNETGEDWLVKNFGAFKAMARLQDFSTLNMAFSGLEVLHLLSPVQKAELLMRPEVASLDNATLTLIFHNLLTGGSNPKPTAFPGGGYNWTSPMYPPTTHNPQLPLSTRNGLREVVNGFMTAFKPIGSFVHEFVTFTRVRNVSEIKSTTFTQFLLNWTLSELADMYRSRNTSVAPQGPKFDVTDVEDWYRQVVLPLLRRFLPNAEALMHENIKLAFHQVFYLEHGLGPDEENETSEIQDVCSITLDKAPCGLTDAVVNVAKVLHCAARTNLTMTEANLMQLVYELTGRLNSLVRELAAANFSEVASDFRNIFTEEEPPTLPQQHLNDPSFIALWFKVKLLPLLPAVPVHILSCLSTKNFTCPVFHTIVGALGHHMSAMKDDPKYSHNIYKYLIYQHLWHRNGSDPQCVSSANHSAEWLLDNFGFFSSFASMADFYRLNPNFSGLEVLPHLSPNQTAELLLLPLPAPPEKDVIIDRVFEFLLESPEDRRLSEVLSSLVEPPCSTYRHIFERLYKAIPSLPPRLEPLVWAGIDELITITPDECLPANITENFTAQQLASLLKCNLPGNSSHSRMIWKMLLTKSIMVLDPALDILANMSMSIVVPSATEVLDVIREIRLNLLTEEQLRNQSVITRWFSRRLSRLLPYASAQFLTCLSLRNLSCHSYQQIMQEFSHHFDKMTTKQQEVLEVLQLLTPTQNAELLVLSHPTLDDKDAIINMIFDYLPQSAPKFTHFLSELLKFLPMLEVLQLLTPTQNAELLVLSHPTLDDKDAIINMIFDYLPQSAPKFTHFLSELLKFLPMLEVLQLLTPTQNAELLVLSHPTLDDKDAIINMIFDYLPQSAPKFTHFLSELLKFLPMLEVLQLLTPTQNAELLVLSHPTLDDKDAIINMIFDYLPQSAPKFTHFLSELLKFLPMMDALPHLTVRQLAEVSSTPGQLRSAAQVNMVMSHVQNQQLPTFFDYFSPAIMLHQNSLQPAVIPAMLQVVFDKANLSDPSVSDSVVWQWLHVRLQPLLFNLSPDHVAPFFSIIMGRNCSVQLQGVQDLNSTISSLSENAQTEIHNHIIQMLKGPKPLQCYGDNYNNSFYTFVENSFMGFKFPNVTAFLSLMPNNRRHQLINSMPPSHLGDFLRRPDVVDDNAELCLIYGSYTKTPLFLETEALPAVVRRPTLPCVWPMALSSSKRSEVNRWFDQSLKNYLVFLRKSLISPSVTYNSSCLAFQKLVSVLGQFNYTTVDFMKPDMYSSIRTYLTSANLPRCYDASDPELNSTAWFAEYIGPFLQFLSLEDFQAFGSAQFIQVFTVNLVNIALLNQTTLPLNLSNYYTQLVYQQDSNFNPIHLPLQYRCVAPGPAFTQLNPQQTLMVFYNLTTVCIDLDPQVSAALAGNLGQNINANAIVILGNLEQQSVYRADHDHEARGSGESPQHTWICEHLESGSSQRHHPEAAVVRDDEGSGSQPYFTLAVFKLQGVLSFFPVLQLNSSSSLVLLGSLVIGIPSTTFSSISGMELLTASKNPSVVSHMVSAPQIVQQTFVAQITAVNSNSDAIAENVPDELASEISRVLLLDFSNNVNIFKKLNRKKWRRQQVELFFSLIAAESSTTTLGGANNLSSSMLQGFSCLSVSTLKRAQVKRLIGACRRKGRNKVPLVETQLTCMYNYIRDDSDVTSFDLYPPDMLLYYDYSLVPQNRCRDYFTQLAEADFSIFSTSLSYKKSALLTNARSCLGITNTILNRDTVAVLGNMCCILDGSYIENSDPSILEYLNNCADLTSGQVTAVEALLQSGRTQHGAPSTWNEQTLKDLGMLPLYLTSTFYENFDRKTKRDFRAYFMKVLKNNKVSRQKRKQFKKEIRRSIKKKTKRSTTIECTAGNITQVTISDNAFPFDYEDINQFNACLSAQTVKDNLAAIMEKVDLDEYLSIVLSKLREAYSSHSTIAESQVQLLGAASRMASSIDINMWNISEVDTLSALMDSSDGEWEPSLAKAIISKYLSVGGNKLGTAELNSIGGPNLCSLDTNVLSNISAQSIKDANALDISNCTSEKKRVLFTIAEQAFTTTTRSTTISPTNYLLLKSYLPGANLNFIRSLSTSNINMDMSTFTSLEENVVLNLTVSEVQNLLGSNLNDLKLYENETLVRSWTSLQLQSELDGLGLGLTGGRSSPTTPSGTTATVDPNAVTSTAAPTVTNTAPSTPTTTTTAATTTGSNGSRIHSDVGLFSLLLLSVFIISQHLLV